MKQIFKVLRLCTNLDVKLYDFVMNAETSVRFLAIVDDRLLNNIDTIADVLTERGLIVDRIRRFTGTISGSCANVDMIKDTHINGIDIMPEQTYSPYGQWKVDLQLTDKSDFETGLDMSANPD